MSPGDRAERGACWLCEGEGAWVRWVGPARFDGPEGSVEAQVYACAGCVARIHRRALAVQRARDLAALGRGG